MECTQFNQKLRGTIYTTPSGNYQNSDKSNANQYTARVKLRNTLLNNQWHLYMHTFMGTPEGRIVIMMNFSIWDHLNVATQVEYGRRTVLLFKVGTEYQYTWDLA